VRPHFYALAEAALLLSDLREVRFGATFLGITAGSILTLKIHPLHGAVTGNLSDTVNRLVTCCSGAP
jgi:hypothetical protein